METNYIMGMVALSVASLQTAKGPSGGLLGSAAGLIAGLAVLAFAALGLANPAWWVPVVGFIAGPAVYTFIVPGTVKAAPSVGIVVGCAVVGAGLCSGVLAR